MVSDGLEPITLEILDTAGVRQGCQSGIDGHFRQKRQVVRGSGLSRFALAEEAVGSDKIEITSGYSDMEIDIDEVQSTELLPKLPNDEYKRVNGSDDGQKKIGKFRGKKTGKCRMYIYVECTPILQINTSDEIIFINSKEKGAAEKWYEKIVQEKNRVHS